MAKAQNILLLAFCLLLTSCTHKINPIEAQISQANQSLQHAQESSNPTAKNQALLNAAEQFLQAHALRQAQTTLQQISTNTLPTAENTTALNPSQQITQQLLRARLALKQNHPITAIKSLNHIDQAILMQVITTSQRIQFKQILAQAYLQLNDPLTSAKVRMGLTNYLLADEIASEKNNLAIWSILQQLPMHRIMSSLHKASTPLNKGWFALALITRDHINTEDTNDNSLSQALLMWKSHYPTHPANQLLPDREKLTQIEKHRTTPLKIALILPTSGPLAGAGNAIKNGFLSAFYAQQSASTSKPDVMLFDSNQQEITSLYQQAIEQGATFVVGPLTKQNIQQLTTQSKLYVPTLVLNSTSTQNTNSPTQNLYEFSLSPTQEAINLAKQAFDSNHRHALLIALKGDWGQQIAQQFQTTFTELGGETSAILWVDTNNTRALTQQISRLLDTAQSEDRAQQLRKRLYRKIRSKVIRRDDIDMVFLALPANLAHQVVPLLKFYYAGDLATYSPSNIYNGQTSKQSNTQNNDLNGVTFYDMPWVLSPKTLEPSLQALRKSLQHTWTQAFNKQPKLFAFGVDAFTIATQLTRLEAFPNLAINGATGLLHLAQNHAIKRTLQLAIMQRGTPHVLATK